MTLSAPMLWLLSIHLLLLIAAHSGCLGSKDWALVFNSYKLSVYNNTSVGGNSEARDFQRALREEEVVS